MYLERLETEKVHVWGNFFYQGVTAYFQRCLRWRSKGFLECFWFPANFLCLHSHCHTEEFRYVLGEAKNWVSACMEHFFLPRCTCLFPEVFEVKRIRDSLNAAVYLQICGLLYATAFLHIKHYISNHNYVEGYKRVLEIASISFLEHFHLPRCTCLFSEVLEVKLGVDSLNAAGFLQIMLGLHSHCYAEEFCCEVGKATNWVSAWLEHFLLPRCICLFPEVFEVKRGVESLNDAAFLQLMLCLNSHYYAEEFRCVLWKPRNWVSACQEHFLLPRSTCLFPKVFEEKRVGDSMNAADFLQICSASYSSHAEEFRCVLGKARNWESACLGQFLLPRSNCLFPEVFEVKEKRIPWMLLFNCQFALSSYSLSCWGI